MLIRELIRERGRKEEREREGWDGTVKFGR
jgi:hypothetical protein